MTKQELPECTWAIINPDHSIQDSYVNTDYVRDALVDEQWVYEYQNDGNGGTFLVIGTLDSIGYVQVISASE
jgi:hypothetical protein